MQHVSNTLVSATLGVGSVIFWSFTVAWTRGVLHSCIPDLTTAGEWCLPVSGWAAALREHRLHCVGLANALCCAERALCGATLGKALLQPPPPPTDFSCEGGGRIGLGCAHPARFACPALQPLANPCGRVVQPAASPAFWFFRWFGRPMELHRLCLEDHTVGPRRKHMNA